MVARSDLRGIALSLALIGAAAMPAGAEPAANLAPAQARLLDRVAIEDMIARFLYNLDRGHVASLGDFFTEDAVFEIYGRKHVGRAAITGYYAARPKTRATRHVSTNLQVEFDDGRHAHSSYVLTYYRAEAGTTPSMSPMVLADYNERLVRGRDGKWRYAYRKASPALAASFAPAPAPSATQQ